MRLALYQPDIPQNTGTMLRMGACLGVEVDIIEPCGFVFDDKKLQRAGMDYTEIVKLHRHPSWQDYKEFLKTEHPNARIILLTTKVETKYYDFAFQKDDVILMGRESAGVPESVHNEADAQVTIPMVAEARSLNVAISAGMALSEALRQTASFPV